MGRILFGQADRRLFAAAAVGYIIVRLLSRKTEEYIITRAAPRISIAQTLGAILAVPYN